MTRFYGCDAHKGYSLFTFHKKWARKHAARLYFRLEARKGHGKAQVAVARHLAEAAYWVLKKKEPYRERDNNKPVSSNQK